MAAVNDVIVIGGGQAGLAAGYYLSQRHKQFMILDENQRTGDSWRRRWDSLRLFTPAKYSSLPGLAFPAADFYFPGKDEAADYMESYAARFSLPVQHMVRVNRVTLPGEDYQVTTSAGTFQARNIIVATGAYQQPFLPTYASELDASIFQIHSSDYCNPRQVPAREILVVGAGNSGVEIAIELAMAGKKVWLAGRDVGRIPAKKVGRILGGRPYWFVVSKLLNAATPIGRKVRENALLHGTPLLGADLEMVAAARVTRTPRVSSVQSGIPQLEDGRSLPVQAVIWATGFQPDYRWIDLPGFSGDRYPQHNRGVVPQSPGLFFVGLHFQSALSSALIGGVGADADYVTRRLR